MNSKTRMSIVWIFVFCVGFVGPSLGQQSPAGGIWTTKSPMPRTSVVLSSSVVDGKIYAIGGGPYRLGVDCVEEYDPGTDTWTSKAGMPTARRTAVSSAVNGKIYVIGGSKGLFDAALSTVEQYDPATDTWTTKANMPTARVYLSSSVVDGKIYVLGGARTFQGTVLSTVEQYDPATDTWTTKAEMPTARNSPSASVVNGRIYVIGGAPGGGQWFQGLSTVEEYDPATDTWASKADMPTARTLFSTSVVNGRVYAIGGDRSDPPPPNGRFSTVEEYDPATDSWTRKADMPTARSMFTTSVVNGKIYAIGGKRGDQLPAVGTVEEFDPFGVITLTIGEFDPIARSVSLTWPSHRRVAYEIEMSTDLVDWELIETTLGTGEQTTTVVSAPSDAPQSFFRLRERP
jgi:N-acetylneuraminic acid mutarotase